MKDVGADIFRFGDIDKRMPGWKRIPAGHD